MAAVGVSNPRTLERIVKKVRRWLRNRGKRYRNVDELKFYGAGEKTRRKFLQLLAEQQNVDIWLLVVEKGFVAIEDTSENYARTVWALLKGILKMHPDAAIFLDKHFSKGKHQLEVNIWLEQRAKETLRIKHGDSQRDARVQIADFVAGAGLAKYQRGDAQFMQILAGKIVVELVTKWAETGSPSTGGKMPFSNVTIAESESAHHLD